MRSVKKCSRAVALLLAFALTLTSVFAVYTGESYASGFSAKLKKIAGTSVINMKGYASLQGLAFDTFTGKDGYCFTQKNNMKTVALIHFTMNSKGKCKRVKNVKYSSSIVGHANDAAVFQDSKGKKWILFTLYGSSEDKYTVKASNGEVIDIGAISLDDYNRGTAKVYKVKLDGVIEKISSKTSANKITGIAFIGNNAISGVSGPCFVVMGGDKMVRAHITESNGAMTLAAVGERGRIEKPTFKGGKAAAFQGIAYHSGYIYLCAEGKTALPTTMLIGRVKMNSVFDGSDSPKKMSVFTKNVKKEGKTKLKKNAPEAIFFTNLNGKSKLYLSVNRKNKTQSRESDSILRSTGKF